MKTSPYRRGYTFERRVIKDLEKKGWTVFRQGKSSFPDLIAFNVKVKGLTVSLANTALIECKVNGRLSREERDAASKFTKMGFVFMVAYRIGRKLHYKYFQEIKGGNT